MTSSITLFGGVFKSPPKINLPCGIESSYPKTQVYLEVNTQQLTESWQELKDQLNKTDFWKMRIISHLAVSPLFHSVTFIPFDFNTPQTWFVQKGEEHEPFKGFFAPFLTEEQQIHLKLKCIEKPDQMQIIKNAEELQLSIQNLENELRWDAFILLSYFFQDPLIYGVSFTYALKDGRTATGFWCKM